MNRVEFLARATPMGMAGVDRAPLIADSCEALARVSLWEASELYGRALRALGVGWHGTDIEDARAFLIADELRSRRSTNG